MNLIILLDDHYRELIHLNDVNFKLIESIDPLISDDNDQNDDDYIVINLLVMIILIC